MLPAPVSRTGYIPQENSLPSKAPVSMKGTPRGWRKRMKVGKLDTSMKPSHSHLRQIPPPTIIWEVVAGGRRGRGLALPSPPFSPSSSSSSLSGGHVCLLEAKCGPAGSGCHGGCFSPLSFETLAMSLRNPLTGGCPHAKGEEKLNCCVTFHKE